MPRKDLQVVQQHPRSSLTSYLASVGEQQKRSHYTLSALEPQALWQWITLLRFLFRCFHSWQFLWLRLLVGFPDSLIIGLSCY